MTVFPSSRGAVTTGQKARQIPENSAGRHDFRLLLEEGWAATVHDIQTGTVITLGRLDGVLSKLKCSLGDVFGEGK